MIDRRSIPWIAGLAVLVLAVLATAAILLWVSSDMTVRSNEFYSGLTGTEQVPDRTYEYWNTISSNAYVLYSVAAPLLVGGLTAVFALLAVLARRFDLTRATPLPGQAVADAPTAS
jgi:TRAP-type C4-dicarboxylate transport system permease small subunit